MSTLLTDTDLESRAAWSTITGPADAVAIAFTAALGHSAALTELERPASAVQSLIDVGAAADRPEATAAIQRWTPRLQSSAVGQALTAAARDGIQLIDPSRVLGLTDLGSQAPHLIWLRGDAAALTGPTRSSVAMIGARASTSYGDTVARELSQQLVNSGMTIVSGAAYGIDGASHRATLEAGGTTVAWLAGGVDRPYPAGHRDLIDRIVERDGAVASEMPPGATPTRWRFVARGRLIAAAAAVTIVVEAGYRSGVLTTASTAVTLGRVLGAVPGPVTSPSSTGCHHLIREYGACLVTDASDILSLIDAGATA